jgi:hypothetical protein
MRPRPPKRGSAATPKAAREHLKLVLGGEEETARRKPKPLAPALRAALAPARRPGKPRRYDPAVGEHLLQEMWLGRFPSAICRDDPGMPDLRTLQHWTESDATFRAAYAKAREALADFLFEDCLRIADDTASDLIVTESGTFGNAPAVLRARLRVDTRKFLAAKLNPRRYGERAGEGPQEHVHRHLIDRPPEETREQWIARRRRELAMGEPAGLPAPSPQEAAGAAIEGSAVVR